MGPTQGPRCLQSAAPGHHYNKRLHPARTAPARVRRRGCGSHHAPDTRQFLSRWLLARAHGAAARPHWLALEPFLAQLQCRLCHFMVPPLRAMSPLGLSFRSPNVHSVTRSVQPRKGENITKGARDVTESSPANRHAGRAHEGGRSGAGSRCRWCNQQVSKRLQQPIYSCIAKSTSHPAGNHACGCVVPQSITWLQPLWSRRAWNVPRTAAAKGTSEKTCQLLEVERCWLCRANGDAGARGRACTAAAVAAAAARPRGGARAGSNSRGGP